MGQARGLRAPLGRAAPISLNIRIAGRSTRRRARPRPTTSNPDVDHTGHVFSSFTLSPNGYNVFTCRKHNDIVFRIPHVCRPVHFN